MKVESDRLVEQRKFGRRQFVIYAALGSSALLSADTKIETRDITPVKDIRDLIANPAQFANQVVWTEGYYEDFHAPYSGIIAQRTTPFTIAGRKFTVDVVNNAYYLQDLFVDPNPSATYLDTRKQTTGYGIDISSFSPNQRYTPHYEHVRVKGRIINQNAPQTPYYVLDVIKQEKIK